MDFVKFPALQGIFPGSKERLDSSLKEICTLLRMRQSLQENWDEEKSVLREPWYATFAPIYLVHGLEARLTRLVRQQLCLVLALVFHV
jgi:hypothetical protein